MPQSARIGHDLSISLLGIRRNVSVTVSASLSTSRWVLALALTTCPWATLSELLRLRARQLDLTLDLHRAQADLVDRVARRGKQIVARGRHRLDCRHGHLLHLLHLHWIGLTLETLAGSTLARKAGSATLRWEALPLTTLGWETLARSCALGDSFTGGQCVRQRCKHGSDNERSDYRGIDLHNGIITLREFGRWRKDSAVTAGSLRSSDFHWFDF